MYYLKLSFKFQKTYTNININYINNNINNINNIINNININDINNINNINNIDQINKTHPNNNRTLKKLPFHRIQIFGIESEILNHDTDGVDGGVHDLNAFNLNVLLQGQHYLIGKLLDFDTCWQFMNPAFCTMAVINRPAVFRITDYSSLNAYMTPFIYLFIGVSWFKVILWFKVMLVLLFMVLLFRYYL